MPFIDMSCGHFCFGMITSMVEPHMLSVGASTTDVGIAFLILGSGYMVTTPLVGIVSLIHFVDISNFNENQFQN